MFKPNRGSRMTVGRKASFWGLYGLPWGTFVNYERITTKLNRDTVGGMVYEHGTFEKAQSYHDKFLSLYGHRGFHVRETRLPYHDKFLIVIRPRPTLYAVGKGIDCFVYRITIRPLEKGQFLRAFSVGSGIYNDKYAVFFTLNKPSRDTGLRGLPRLSYHGKLCSYHGKSYHGKPSEGFTTRENCLVYSGVLAGWCS